MYTSAHDVLVDSIVLKKHKSDNYNKETAQLQHFNTKIGVKMNIFTKIAPEYLHISKISSTFAAVFTRIGLKPVIFY